MISTAGLSLRWVTVALALFASAFPLGNLAQGQDQPGQDERPRVNDSQVDQRRSRWRGGQSLKVGQYAPTFNLASPDGKETFDLRDWRGKRPVVLIFGSYT